MHRCVKKKTKRWKNKIFSSNLSFLKNVLCTQSDIQTSWKEEAYVWIMSIYMPTLQKREKFTFIWINKSNVWPKQTLILAATMIQNFLFYVLRVSWLFISKCCAYTFKMVSSKIWSAWSCLRLSLWFVPLTPNVFKTSLLGLNTGSKKAICA